MYKFFIFNPAAGARSGEVPNPPAPRPTRKSDRPSGKPDICKGHFDTIAILRGEMFVFKVTTDPS